ncbi:HAD family hydrolase, partial [Klebsiella pneumoniae]|nr:HAD family hydrolase [Klebsiella pneumoniae]
QVPHLEALQLAASVQQASEHPLARAVVNAAKEKGLTLSRASDATALTGRGIEATVDGRRLVIASERWFMESAIGVSSELELVGKRAQEAGFSVSWLVETQPATRVLAMMAFGDAIKNTSPVAIRALSALGVRTVLLTGDN